MTVASAWGPVHNVVHMYALWVAGIVHDARLCSNSAAHCVGGVQAALCKALAAEDEELRQSAATLVRAVFSTLAPVCLALQQLGAAGASSSAASTARAMLRDAASQRLPSVQALHQAAAEAWQHGVKQLQTDGHAGGEASQAAWTNCEMLLQVRICRMQHV